MFVIYFLIFPKVWCGVRTDGKESEQNIAPPFPGVTHGWLGMQECIGPRGVSTWTSWALRHQSKFVFSYYTSFLLLENGDWFLSRKKKKQLCVCLCVCMCLCVYLLNKRADTNKSCWNLYLDSSVFLVCSWECKISQGQFGHLYQKSLSNLSLWNLTPGVLSEGDVLRERCIDKGIQSSQYL